jgi:hypothetical protein
VVVVLGVGVTVDEAITVNVDAALEPPAVRATMAPAARPVGTAKVADTVPFEPTTGVDVGVTSSTPLKAVMNSIVTTLYVGNPVPLTVTAAPRRPLLGDRVMAAAGTVNVA